MAGTHSSFLQNTKFEELCRLCGSKTDMLAVHIFENEGTFSDLGKKIYNCLHLQIHQQDELPKLLCDKCLVKLEMLWDFKDRSFRTEQLLIELCKQLKSGGGQQQCVVSLDSSGMILQVPNNQILSSDFPSDIDIPQLDHRENSDTSDYTVVLHHDQLHTTHLDNLELTNHNLTGQNLSNHGSQDHLVILSAPESDGRFTEDSLNLMQQHLLNEAEFKFHHDLQGSVANGGTVYTHNEIEQSYSKTCQGKEFLDTTDYCNGKSSLNVDSNLSDNSLGVEVDTRFDRLMSYSSDSQMDRIHAQEESDSNPNIPDDRDITDVNDAVKERFLLSEDTMQYREVDNISHSMLLAAHSNNQFFKYEDEDLIYEDSLKPRNGSIRRDLLNYKQDISLDSLDSFKNEDSNSLGISSSPINSASNEQNDNNLLNKSPDLNKIQRANEEGKVQSKPGQKVCSVCGKTYKSNYKLAEHMTKHTGERPYKCKSCDKAFRSKIGLAQHEAKHTGQYELRCPTCGKGFQCRSYLMVHQRVHSDVKPFPCATCGINFKTKQSLLDHTNRHLGVKPFSCSICNRGFINKSLCAAHEKTHTGVDNRKYACKICQKRFVSKSYLQTHSRIHTGEKSFICEVCGKGFLAFVDLKIHLTMHTGEKSYVCEICGKAFARRDALNCHRRMHTGERPYRCDVCGRTFTQFTPMAIHRRHHTGEKPFSCDTCGKTFVSKSTMVAHQKKHIKPGTKTANKGKEVVPEELASEQNNAS